MRSDINRTYLGVFWISKACPWTSSSLKTSYSRTCWAEKPQITRFWNPRFAGFIFYELLGSEGLKQRGFGTPRTSCWRHFGMLREAGCRTERARQAAVGPGRTHLTGLRRLAALVPKQDPWQALDRRLRYAKVPTASIISSMMAPYSLYLYSHSIICLTLALCNMIFTFFGTSVIKPQYVAINYIVRSHFAPSRKTKIWPPSLATWPPADKKAPRQLSGDSNLVFCLGLLSLFVVRD